MKKNANNLSLIKNDNPESKKKKVKYDPKFCKELIAHMKSGLSFETFAVIAGVRKHDLYYWAKKHKEFREAKEEAFLWRQMHLEQTILLAATGAQRGNATLLKMMACNLLGWASGDIPEDKKTDSSGDTVKKEIIIKTSYDPRLDKDEEVS